MVPAATTSIGGRERWLVAGALALILGALLLVYANSFSGVFVFDDFGSITENPTLRTLGWSTLLPPGRGVTVTGRPLLNLSLALDYARSGTRPTAYHQTNLLIHALAALVLFGLIRRTLRRPALAPRYGEAALPLAFVLTLLWALHPLQTESVTYVVQRAESLMGCLYLVTLYAFARSLDAPRPGPWRCAAWIACLAGMATKEVMASAPLVVLLYDWQWGAGSWREVWRQRRFFHAALAATWLVLAALILAAGNRGGTVGGDIAATATGYWATQPVALLKYLGLTVWPWRQVFDHGTEWVKVYPAAVAAGAVMTTGLVVLGLAFRRHRNAAVLGAWFLLVLAPTSLMPGGRQTMAEHRLYLALVPLLALGVIGSFRRVPFAAWCLIVGALGLLTVARNRVYASPLALWQDTVAGAPDNPWARDNLAKAWFDLHRPADALRESEAAIRLRPWDPVSHFSAGNAFVALQRPAEAATHYRDALRLDPAYFEARFNLGLALYQQQEFAAAAAEFSQAIEAHPGRAELYSFYGNALARSGQSGAAISALRTALRLDPQQADAAYNLGMIYLRQQRWADAITALTQAVGDAPQRAEAYAALGVALVQADRLTEAVAAWRTATQIAPDDADLHNNLGAVYRTLGRTAEAATEFATALRLNPRHALASRNLTELQQTGR